MLSLEHVTGPSDDLGKSQFHHTISISSISFLIASSLLIHIIDRQHLTTVASLSPLGLDRPQSTQDVGSSKRPWLRRPRLPHTMLCARSAEAKHFREPRRPRDAHVGLWRTRILRSRPGRPSARADRT